MAVVQYGSAPPGARKGAKATGVGAPGSTGYNPAATATTDTGEVDIAAAVAAAEAGFDFGDIGFGDMSSGSGNSGPPKSYYDAMGAARTDAAKTASDTLLFNMGKYQDQQALDAAALARKGLGAQEALKYYETQLADVQGGKIPAALNTTLDEQKVARDAFANTTYDNLLSRLGTRYGEAQGITDEGYNALKSYLEGAPQNTNAKALSIT